MAPSSARQAASSLRGMSTSSSQPIQRERPSNCRGCPSCLRAELPRRAGGGEASGKRDPDGEPPGTVVHDVEQVNRRAQEKDGTLEGGWNRERLAPPGPDGHDLVGVTADLHPPCRRFPPGGPHERADGLPGAEPHVLARRGTRRIDAQEPVRGLAHRLHLHRPEKARRHQSGARQENQHGQRDPAAEDSPVRPALQPLHAFLGEDPRHEGQPRHDPAQSQEPAERGEPFRVIEDPGGERHADRENRYQVGDEEWREGRLGSRFLLVGRARGSRLLGLDAGRRHRGVGVRGLGQGRVGHFLRPCYIQPERPRRGVDAMRGIGHRSRYSTRGPDEVARRRGG